MWSKGNGRVGHLRGTPRGVPWKCFPEMLIGLRVWIRKCKKFRSLCFGCLVRVNHLHKLLQRPSSKLFVAYLQVHILCVYAWTFVLPYLENIFNRDFALWIYLEALYLVTTHIHHLAMTWTYKDEPYTYGLELYLLIGRQEVLCIVIRSGRSCVKGDNIGISQYKGPGYIRDVTEGARKTNQTFVIRFDFFSSAF